MRLRLKRGLLAASWLVGCGQAVASSTDATSAHDVASVDLCHALDGMTAHDGTTLRDVGTISDTRAKPDVATCGTPFDATMPLPDGGVCTVGNCDRWGMECCPGFECAVCPIAIGDGSYIFDREAGPFYCNVTMR